MIDSWAVCYGSRPDRPRTVTHPVREKPSFAKAQSPVVDSGEGQIRAGRRRQKKKLKYHPFSAIMNEEYRIIHLFRILLRDTEMDRMIQRDSRKISWGDHEET